MIKTVNREGPQSLEPIAAYGSVKTCKKPEVIKKAIGIELYNELQVQAAKALEPDFPELALIYPVLSFNTYERGKLAFYKSLTLGKLDEDETDDLTSWIKKLPEDDGQLYQRTAKLMKWSL